MLAAVGLKLRFPGHPDAITWMIPVLVLGIPVLDMSLVTLSRLRRRVNPWTTAGQDHLSHRLVKMGMTHRRAVLLIYLLCLIAGALGFVLQYVSIELAFIILALALVIGLPILMAAALGFVLEYVSIALAYIILALALVTGGLLIFILERMPDAS